MAVKKIKEEIVQIIEEVETIVSTEPVLLVRDVSKALSFEYNGDNECYVPANMVQLWLDSPHGWVIKE